MGKAKPAMAYKMAFAPVLLKELALDCGISQTTIAVAGGISRAAANLICNRGYFPIDRPEAKEAIERMITADPRAMQWLIARQMQVGRIWDPAGKALRNAVPDGTGFKSAATKRHGSLAARDLEQHIIRLEVEMESISQGALKHFKLFRDPFRAPFDVQKDADIFMSEEHRYIEAAMLDAARHGGFLAVIGEVGSGKSIILKKVVGQLKKDGGCHIIAPRSGLDCTMDRSGSSKITPGKLIDAIIRDISDQTVDTRLEHKARQMEKLLRDRSQQGYQSVLIIDEAHSLQLNTFKYLKRFYEIEDGYKKMLGIILIGQAAEMKRMLDEELHPELREVIRRIQVAEIRGLNGNVKSYLALKFKRINVKLEDVIDDSAITALSRRLTSVDRREKPISHAYPLTIHSYVAAAMNIAYEMGEPVVRENAVMAI
ncbi:MAG: AAA family ATPase [Deltaproteobacteria bacterium]|nr:AAA family ATPase [Deltaproteobacteria bacterium]